MAICLRRIFKSGGTVMFVGRRNRQTDCLSHKIPGSAKCISKEVARDFFPSNTSCACNFNATLPVSSTGFVGVMDVPDICNFKKHNPIYLYTSKLDCLRLTNVVHCAKECKAYKEDKNIDVGTGKAGPEQIDHVFNVLSNDLPKIFNKNLNYTIYHRDMVFENNIRGTKILYAKHWGLGNYVKQMCLLRAVGHIKFARVTVDILKITAHPEDGTVRVRWRIRGIPNLKALTSFLKLFSKYDSKETEGWYDGFSIFYVKSDGLVHKHTVDKMMPDSQEKVSNFQDNLAAKLALALGVAMKDFSSPALFEDFFCVNEREYPYFLQYLEPMGNQMRFRGAVSPFRRR